MSVTPLQLEQLKEFEEEYFQTSGICFQFTYSKIRKKWVAYTFGKKFEDADFFKMLNKVTDYIIKNRIPTNKENYQFKNRFWVRKN
jgi:hypothetical protein